MLTKMHIMGTVKIDFKVKGTESLRVADISVLPVVVSAYMSVMPVSMC